jgi:hypothetical protein
VASDVVASTGEKSMRSRASAASAADGSGNDAPVSVQTTSQTMTLPSAMHFAQGCD